MVIVKKAVDRVVKSGHVILCHDIEGLWIGDGGVWFFVPGAPRMTETEFRSLYDVPQTVKISEEPDALAAYSLNHTEQGDEYLEKVNAGISLGAEAYLNPARGNLTPETMEKLEEFLQLCRDTMAEQRRSDAL